MNLASVHGNDLGRGQIYSFYTGDIFVQRVNYIYGIDINSECNICEDTDEIGWDMSLDTS